jgi:hypothetical protein
MSVTQLSPKKRKPKQRGKTSVRKIGKPKKKDLSTSYNEFKEFGGKQYSGMRIGRSHHWHYDQGDWKETKITPDLWEVFYSVTKRRLGHAPRKLHLSGQGV